MTKITSSYLQYGQMSRSDVNRPNSSCLIQKQQDNFTKKSGSQEDLHSGMVRRQSIVQSMISCFSFLTSIRNCDFMPAALAQNGSARKNHLMACNVLKMQNGFTKASAKALLCEYNFPYGGRVFSAYTFARHIKQTGNVPVWAEQFKKMPGEETYTKGEIKTISVLHPDFPEHKIDFHLGKKLDRGAAGEVFLDADDTQYVIKKYFYDDILDTVKHEAETFQRYYGEGSAQILYEENGQGYLRMYKVPGEVLSKLSFFLPDDAVNRYVDMLEKLNKVDIMHNDLHSENVLWDADSQTFFPIDMKNMKEWYFNGNRNDAKNSKDLLDSVFWNITMECIESNM